MDYPFALHTLDAASWTWHLRGNTLFLIHLQCTGESDSGFRQGCCGRCWSLAKHPTFPVVQSSTLGAPPLPLGAPPEHHSLNGLLAKVKELETKLVFLGNRCARLQHQFERGHYVQESVDG